MKWIYFLVCKADNESRQIRIDVPGNPYTRTSIYINQEIRILYYLIPRVRLYGWTRFITEIVLKSIFILSLGGFL